MEYGYVPGFHLLAPTAKLRAGVAEGQKSTGKKGSVPLYIAPDGKILDDSWQILSYARGSVPADLQELLNNRVGPQARALVYSYLLAPENVHLFKAIGAQAPVSWWQRWLWPIASGTIAGKTFEMMVRNDAHVAEQKQILFKALDEVDALIQQIPRGPFAPSPDGKPSAPAIALSSLLAPLTSVDSYTGGYHDVIECIGGLQAYPAGLQDLIKEISERPCGRFVLETYKKRMDFQK